MTIYNFLYIFLVELLSIWYCVDYSYELFKIFFTFKIFHFKILQWYSEEGEKEQVVFGSEPKIKALFQRRSADS